MKPNPYEFVCTGGPGLVRILGPALRGILLGRGYGIKSLPKWLHPKKETKQLIAKNS